MAGTAPRPTYYGPSGMEDVSVSGSSGSIGGDGGDDSIHNPTIRFDTIDAITTLYASKLMEGYTLAENGEVCFRCHMPLMQRGEQQQQEEEGRDKYACRGAAASALLDLDESTSIISGPKRICVVCHEEWESADSFEQKLVVFSAMQAAQTQLEGEDDDENEDSSREDESSRSGDKYSYGVSVPRQSTTLNDDGETNNVGDDDYYNDSDRMARVKFNIPSLSNPLEIEDLIIASSQTNNNGGGGCDDDDDDEDYDDDDAMMNIEVTLRTRCKCCAMDLPISESLQYYPRGATECSFCRAADGDSFDLSVIQANLDMLDVKEELLMEADDRSAERETNGDESSIIIAAGKEVDDDSRITSPIMETDGAEVRLMKDWNDGDQVVPSSVYDDCSQTKDVTHGIALEREDIESNGVTVLPDESNNSTMSADEPIADMQPQQHVNDSIPAVNFMANPPRDKEHFVKGLIATFLQQNLFGQSGPSLNGDNGGKTNTMCSDYENQDQNKLKTDPSMSDDVDSKRNRNSHFKRRMKTTTFTRDPPTNRALDPPTTTDAISSGEDMRQVSSSSRGMDPPESAEDMLDSRDMSSSPANSTSIEMRDSVMNRWFPGKSSLPKPMNDTLPETKVPLRRENTPHKDATMRVDRRCSSNDTVNGAPPPAFKFHAKKQCDKPIRGDGEPILSEDDVRGQLALLKFQFSRKATIGKEMTKSSILPPTTSSHLQTNNNDHRTTISSITTAPCSKQQLLPLSPTSAARHQRTKAENNGRRTTSSCSTTAPCIEQQLLPLSPTAAARHQRITAENNEHRTTSSSSTTAPCSEQQLMPLSPTAAARHKRIKEDLIARRKAMSLNPPSSLVSIE